MNKFKILKRYKLDTLVMGMCILVAVSTILSYSADFKINSSITYVDIDALLKVSKRDKYTSLDKVLKDTAIERQVIIFPKTSLIAGGTDITEDVKQLLIKTQRFD